MTRLALCLALLGASVACCPKPAVVPIASIPQEPPLETATLPDTSTPEQTQDAMTRDLARWVGYARQLRALLRPYEEKPKTPAGGSK